MFEHDSLSRARLMSTRGLYVFEHTSALGEAPAHVLFERIIVTQKDPAKPAREFSDFEVTVDKDKLPTGVTLNPMV